MESHSQPTPEGPGFHAAVPILRVRRSAVSLDFYTRVLGFHVDWKVSGMASVSRGCTHLMLCEGAQGHPGTWVWIGVHDASVVHQEFEARHATIRLPPTNYPWAREFHLEDPDGHILRMGSEPLEGQPFPPWQAWYEPVAPLSFSDAVTGLLRGDFSRLAPLFASGGQSTGDIVRWQRAGLFHWEPEAALEALTCACFNGGVEVAQDLIAGGTPPVGGAATGLNALHWAANRGQLEAVRLLLRHRVPLETRNSHGGTALGCAVWSAVHEPRPEHPAIVEALLEAGAEVREAGEPPADPRIRELLRRYGAARPQSRP